MPKVPAAQGNVVPMMKPPEEVYFAMAAAGMDQMGKLFEKEPELNLDNPHKRMKNFIEKSRDEIDVGRTPRESPLPDNVG